MAASHVYVRALGARLLPQSYQFPNSKHRFTTSFVGEDAGKRCSECDQKQYPNLSEGADRIGGQLRRYKECPFSGVTKSGGVWRKVPESDARSVPKD